MGDELQYSVMIRMCENAVITFIALYIKNI